MDCRGEGLALSEDSESVGEVSDIVLRSDFVDFVYFETLRIEEETHYLERHGGVVLSHGVRQGVLVNHVEHSRQDAWVGPELSSLLWV